MESFVGATISLISKSDIRYIGTLHSINQVESTVALENVRSQGTEGRKGNPTDEIHASPQVFEFIVFRGSDIKDLQVVTAPAPQPASAVPNDPAIVSSTKPPISQPPTIIQQQTHKLQAKVIPSVSKPTEDIKPVPKYQPHKAQTVAADVVVEDFGNLSVADSSHEGQSRQQQYRDVLHSQYQSVGDNQNNRGQRGGRNGNSGGNKNNQNNRRNNAFAVPSSDFDFQSANAKFNKSEVTSIRTAADVEAEEALAPRVVSPSGDESFYDKGSSFFDNISCDARDRAEGERRVVRGQEERKMNLETFGQATSGNRSGYRNRGGRGGQGRRSGYNGGGNRSQNGTAQSTA